MHKKLMMACMAIAAFAAFVVAPAASASPILTDEGQPLAVGTSITGKNTGETRFTGGFEVKCSVAHFTGTLKSAGTPIKGEIPVGGANFTGTGAGGTCTSALGNTTVNVTSKICLETVAATDNVNVSGCGGVITFDLTAAGITCKYSTASLTGTYITNAEATVNLSEQPATEENHELFFCPDTGKIDMDIDLYTTGATPGGPPGVQLTIS